MIRAVLPGLLLALLGGCVLPAPVLKGHQDTLRQSIHAAKAQGAMVCAPGELAQAQAAYRFASLEFSQGHATRAWEHLEFGLAQAEQAKSQSQECDAQGVQVADTTQDPWPDADGDGVARMDDLCPYVLEDIDDFEDEDGCPEPDNDGDGLLDADDACVDEPEDFDEFQDEDGCPERDNDSDGIFDHEDLCPDEPETRNGYEDEDGCPDMQPRHLTIDGNRMRFKAPLQFVDGEEPTLLSLSLPALGELKGLLAVQQEWVIEVQGFSHNRGEPAELEAESLGRARAVSDALVSQGVEAERVKPVGRGSADPVTTNRTASGREKNRRVEIAIFVQGPDGLVELGATSASGETSPGGAADLASE